MLKQSKLSIDVCFILIVKTNAHENYTEIEKKWEQMSSGFKEYLAARSKFTY